MRSADQAQLATVIDGDTVELADGRHVRLIGVNAPERARRGKPAEAGAERARDFARRFLGQGLILVSEGEDARDRYDRTLAHVSRADGRSLEQGLIEAGLARVAVIPPNIDLADCLLAAEQRARSARAGLWASGAFAPRDARELGDGESGFRLLRGTLGPVVQTGANWWIDIDGRVALQISRADRRYFDLASLRALAGHEVEVRGWLVWRDSARNRARKRAPWIMRLGHPLALRAAAS